MEEQGGVKSLKTGEGFDLLNSDLLHNILLKLPAVSFAQAACVNRLWNQVCNRIFTRPIFASAISVNKVLEDAVGEVIDRVLSAPIRPHFAIVVVSPYFSLETAHRLLHKRLGTTTPIITSETRGMIGRDAINNKFKEIMWHDNELDVNGEQRGICLFVGFIPGVKVDIIPFLWSGKTFSNSMDIFIGNVREFANTASGSPSPEAIMLFGEQDSSVRFIVEKVDNVMPPGTVIVGSAHGSFIFEGPNSSSYAYQGKDGFCTSTCVALVFARDIHKSQDIGETHFHVTISDGLRPMGNMYKAVSVRTPGVDKSSTWLTGKRDGSNEVLNGQRMVEDIDDEMGDDAICCDLFAGIIKHRKYSVGMEKQLPVTTLSFYWVSGYDRSLFYRVSIESSRPHLEPCFVLFRSVPIEFVKFHFHSGFRFDEEYLFLDGLGIRTGDSFQFYSSDSIVAQSSCSKVSEELRGLKNQWTCQHCSPTNPNVDTSKREVCGGFVFACCGRGEWFFEKPNVDSSPLVDAFPEIPVAGLFCNGGEIGRGCESSVARSVQGTPRCPLHVYSSVYLLVSYSPPVASRH